MNLKYLVVLGVLALTACFVPDSLEEHRDIVRNFVESNPQVVGQYLDTEGFRLHYRQTGNAQDGVAVWIHGTPGSWRDAVRLVLNEKLVSSIRVVAFDRPGWGESQYVQDPRIVTSFEEQGRLIRPLLVQQREENPNTPVFLVGHSLGGSLAPSIALQYPDLVDGVIIAAGGLSPELTKPRWYNRLGNTWAAGSFLGEDMKAANLEVYALQPQLEELKSRWKSLTLPIIAIQGENDKLVHPANADFIENNFPGAYVLRLPDQGHLLQMERTDFLATCILAMSRNDLTACAE